MGLLSQLNNSMIIKKKKESVVSETIKISQISNSFKHTKSKKIKNIDLEIGIGRTASFVITTFALIFDFFLREGKKEPKQIRCSLIDVARDSRARCLLSNWRDIWNRGISLATEN